MKLVKEKFEVTNNNKLSLPPFLNPTRLWNLHVTLICSSNASGRVNAKRSLCLIRRNWAGCRDSVFTANVAGKTTYLTDNTLKEKYLDTNSSQLILLVSSVQP